MNRRKFVASAGTTAVGLTVLNFPVFGRLAPSNKVVLAVMGVNSRGAYLAEQFSRLTNVEVAYLCDVEENALAKGLKPFQSALRRPKIERDIRKMLTYNDFDGLVIATPDHWHAPASIMALQHGKHVYVEKPHSHNPYEGELLVQAMRKYGKLVQMGNQRRSMPTLQQAAHEVRSGIIGRPYMGKCWYNNNRKSIGVGKKVPVPATLDWDLWQGPAPRVDYKDNIVHYNWHWFWHWGTTETCNNATHELDCCRWFMGLNYPTRVVSSGGRYAYKDDWEMPDTQTVSFEFEQTNQVIIWEGRSCNNFNLEGSGRGFAIYGDNGTLVNYGGGDYKIFDLNRKLVKEIKSETEPDPYNPVSASGNLDLYHFQNFADGIRGEAKLTAAVDEGHISVMYCHLANIAQRTGRILACDPANGLILNDADAMRYWKRSYQPGWEPKV